MRGVDLESGRGDDLRRRGFGDTADIDLRAGLARTFGEQSACQLVNNNYPDTLRNISVPGHPVADLGAFDVYRDRERGCWFTQRA